MASPAGDAVACFADLLVERVRELGHPLCAGLDPHLERIPEPFRQGSMRPGDPRTADAVEAFLGAFADRLEGRVAVAKPQVAFFEQLGWRGLRALERVVARLRQRGIRVLLDAKRGDIGSTAEGYARAWLRAEGPAEPCDALTVHPWMGRDGLDPFLAAAREEGRGVFVLVKTSNAGSRDLQDRETEGRPLYACLAELLAADCEALRGPRTGWSSLGVVVGATFPGPAERVREALPRALFLVPGYGAQGAGAAEALRGFVAGPKGREGGVVNASRSLLFPEGAEGAQGAAAWERAVDAALERATGELGDAVAR